MAESERRCPSRVMHTCAPTRHLWVASDGTVESSSVTSHDHPVW